MDLVIVVIAVCALMLLCSLIVGQKYGSILEGLCFDIEQLISSIKSSSLDTVDLRLASKLKEDNEVLVQWRAFYANVKEHESQQLNGIPTPYSTVASEDYFNKSTLTMHLINLKMMGAVPSLLTGCGLLFTFLGLAIGMLYSSQNSDYETQYLVDRLVQSAGIAFWTSVAGLFTSLIFIVYSKKKVYKLDSTIQSLNREIAKRVPFVPPEEILFASHMTQLVQQKAFVEYLSQWKGDLKELLEHLVSQQNDSYGKLTEKLEESLGALNTALHDMSEGQVGTLSTIFEEMMESFQKGIAQELSTISESFETSADSVNHAVDGLNQALSTMNGVVEQTGQLFDEQLKQLATHLSGMLQNVQKATEVVDTSLMNTVQKLGGVQDRMIEVGDTFLEKASEGMIALTAGAQDIRTSVETSVQEFKSEVVQAGDDFKAKTQESAQQFNAVLLGFANDLNVKLSESAQGLADKLASVINVAEMVKDTLAHMETMNAQGDKTLNSMVESVNSIVESARSLADVAEVFKSLPAQLKVVLDDVEEVSQKQVSGSTQQAQMVKQLINDITMSQQQLFESLGRLDDHVQKNYEGLAEALQLMHKTMDANLKEADGYLASAMGSLSETVRSIADQSQSDNETRSKYVHAMKVCSEQLTQVVNTTKALADKNEKTAH